MELDTCGGEATGEWLGDDVAGTRLLGDFGKDADVAVAVAVAVEVPRITGDVEVEEAREDEGLGTTEGTDDYARNVRRHGMRDTTHRHGNAR